MAPPEINPGFNMTEEFNGIKEAKGKYIKHFDSKILKISFLKMVGRVKNLRSEFRSSVNFD